MGAEKRVWHHEAHTEATKNGDDETPDRNPGGLGAKASYETKIGFEAGHNQEEEGAEPSNAREQGTLDGLGGEEPGLSGRGELAQHGRAKQEAGGEFTDHRGLANPPQECPEHARCEEQHEELKPKDEELMLCQHAEGTPPGFVR